MTDRLLSRLMTPEITAPSLAWIGALLALGAVLYPGDQLWVAAFGVGLGVGAWGVLLAGIIDDESTLDD